jgi:hypothetical protein
MTSNGKSPIPGEPCAPKGASTVRRGGQRNTVRLCAPLLPYYRAKGASLSEFRRKNNRMRIGMKFPRTSVKCNGNLAKN